MSKLKVLHVIPYLKFGGAENIVKILSKYLIEDGNDVNIMAYDCLDKEVVNSFERDSISLIILSQTQLINLFPKNFSSLLWLIFNFNKIRSYDVIHCHLTFGSIFAFYIFMIRKVAFRSFPVIVQTNHSVGSPISQLKQKIYNYLFSFCDGLALISMNRFWQEIKQKKTFPLIKEIKNGASIDAAKILNIENQTKLKKKLSLDAPIVGTLGRLDRDRAPERFLHVFHSVADKNQDINFVVCGDGECKGELIQYTKNNNFFNRTIFMSSTSETESIFSLCDYYVTANVEDMTGLTGIESALCGTPVIAVQWQKGYNGKDDWIWSSDDTEEVASKICDDLDSPEHLKNLSNYQLNYAKENLSVESMSKDYIDLYRELLKN